MQPERNKQYTIAAYASQRLDGTYVRLLDTGTFIYVLEAHSSRVVGIQADGAEVSVPYSELNLAAPALGWILVGRRYHYLTRRSSRQYQQGLTPRHFVPFLWDDNHKEFVLTSLSTRGHLKWCELFDKMEAEDYGSNLTFTSTRTVIPLSKRWAITSSGHILCDMYTVSTDCGKTFVNAFAKKRFTRAQEQMEHINEETRKLFLSE